MEFCASLYWNLHSWFFRNNDIGIQFKCSLSVCIIVFSWTIRVSKFQFYSKYLFHCTQISMSLSNPAITQFPQMFFFVLSFRIFNDRNIPSLISTLWVVSAQLIGGVCDKFPLMQMRLIVSFALNQFLWHAVLQDSESVGEESSSERGSVVDRPRSPPGWYHGFTSVLHYVLSHLDYVQLFLQWDYGCFSAMSSNLDGS